MTIWEMLFGTPERVERTFEDVDQIDVCYWMTDVHGDDKHVPDKCRLCLYEYDRYGCERKDMSLTEWLKQEVTP